VSLTPSDRSADACRSSPWDHRPTARPVRPGLDAGSSSDAAWRKCCWWAISRRRILPTFSSKVPEAGLSTREARDPVVFWVSPASQSSRPRSTGRGGTSDTPSGVIHQSPPVVKWTRSEVSLGRQDRRVNPAFTGACESRQAPPRGTARCVPRRRTGKAGARLRKDRRVSRLPRESVSPVCVENSARAKPQVGEQSRGRWGPPGSEATPDRRRRHGIPQTCRAKAQGLEAFLESWNETCHVPYTEHRQQILDQSRNFLWWEMDLSHAAT
jgi:hypothetical protein